MNLYHSCGKRVNETYIGAVCPRCGVVIDQVFSEYSLSFGIIPEAAEDASADPEIEEISPEVKDSAPKSKKWEAERGEAFIEAIRAARKRKHG